MNSRVYFATFDLLHDVPNVCGVCISNPPVFRYEFWADGKDMQGFCCAPCAAKLLTVLERVESQEWAREQGVLEADDMDVTEFQKR